MIRSPELPFAATVQQGEMESHISLPPVPLVSAELLSEVGAAYRHTEAIGIPAGRIIRAAALAIELDGNAAVPDAHRALPDDSVAEYGRAALALISGMARFSNEQALAVRSLSGSQYYVTHYIDDHTRESLTVPGPGMDVVTTAINIGWHNYDDSTVPPDQLPPQAVDVSLELDGQEPSGLWARLSVRGNPGITPSILYCQTGQLNFSSVPKPFGEPVSANLRRWSTMLTELCFPQGAT